WEGDIRGQQALTNPNMYNKLKKEFRSNSCLVLTDYPPGYVYSINDLNIYDVGSNYSSSTAIVVVYDIRGFNISQTRVFCDRLSFEYKARVVMPDFFRGNEFRRNSARFSASLINILGTAAPANMSELGAWLAQAGNWSQVEKDLIMVNEQLKKDRAKQLAILGFCWGGLQVLRACGQLADYYSTGISIHGASLTVTDAQNLQRPMMFLAAGNDPPLTNITATLNQKSFGNLCEYKVYPNMIHGFASAGANFSNPENVAALDDVHDRCNKFLTKILTNSGMIVASTVKLVLLTFYILVNNIYYI
ncbi:unnamed protein product, partial [Didymodactylos carnosus]